MDTACLNCGAELLGKWCAQCGQRVAAPRPTLHELLHDAFHEIAHFDGKIIRTVALLLFRPGMLTREFLDGRRVRYITPIRVYLLCSLLFFGTLSLMPAGKLRVSISKGGDAQLQQAAAKVNKDPSILANALQAAFPKAMFILMPLFGLIVFAFYFRAERLYVPHFYFSVHYHAFVFVLLTLFEVIGLVRGFAIGIIRLVLLLGLFVYLGTALRRVYGGTRWITTAKTAAIVPLYGGFVLMAMALIAFLRLRRL
jgi:Protein of unknown function (DUF3667)